MSIASRITTMTEHIDDIYDTVELTGVDTTGLNKNLVNVPNTLKDGFVDIINNGIDTLYENFPKVAQTSEEPTLNGVYEAPMGVDLNGNTEQTTYTGKNKYGITSAAAYVYASSFPSSSSDRITIDNYDLDNISFHTTGTGYLIALLPIFQLTPNTNYILTYSRTNILGSGISTRRYIYNVNENDEYSSLIEYINSGDEGNQNVQFTTGTTGKIALAFGFSRTTEENTGSSTINNLMVRLATESDTYEPYVGGTASPNPDYPQPIRVVKGDNTIKVTGKNLLPLTNQDFTLNGLRYYVQNGTLYINGTSSGETVNDPMFKQNFSILLPAGTYYFQRGNSVLPTYIKKVSDETSLATNNGSFTLTEETNVYLTFYVYQKTINNEKIECQLEKSSTATTYQPYQEQSYPVDLGTTELCEIDDYKDYIYKENDKWYLKKNIGKVVVDTSNITLRSNYTNIEYAEIPKPNDFIGKGNYDDYNVYCSHAISDIKNAAQYAWDSTYRIGKITNKANVNNFWLGFPKDTGLDNIKTALNGAVIYYVLATPTGEEITDTTLINQLEDLKTAKSVEGQTNITQTNEELPFIINASALSKV